MTHHEMTQHLALATSRAGSRLDTLGCILAGRDCAGATSGDIVFATESKFDDQLRRHSDNPQTLVPLEFDGCCVTIFLEVARITPFTECPAETIMTHDGGDMFKGRLIARSSCDSDH